MERLLTHKNTFMKRFLLLTLSLIVTSGSYAIDVENLRCEYMSDPLGIDVTEPRLSWTLTSNKRGDLQTAYRILVASSAELLKQGTGDVWDSGKVETDRSVQVEYEGKSLQSGKPYYWKVQVWDAAGRASAWSDPAVWSMGLLDEAAWNGAQWIAYKEDPLW